MTETAPPFQAATEPAPQAAETGPGGTQITEADIEARINAALAERDAQAAENLRIATGATPLPRHSAGPKHEVAEQWGLADQQAAIAAEDASRAG